VPGHVAWASRTLSVFHGFTRKIHLYAWLRGDYPVVDEKESHDCCVMAGRLNRSQSELFVQLRKRDET
jgi:hypothetical protein